MSNCVVFKKLKIEKRTACNSLEVKPASSSVFFCVTSSAEPEDIGFAVIEKEKDELIKAQLTEEPEVVTLLLFSLHRSETEMPDKDVQ